MTLSLAPLPPCPPGTADNAIVGNAIEAIEPAALPVALNNPSGELIKSHDNSAGFAGFNRSSIQSAPLFNAFPKL